MSRHSLMDSVILNLRVPRGEAGYWAIILHLDAAGPWTVRQVSDCTNVDVSIVANYVRKLRLAGIADCVAEQANGINGRNLPGAKVYRLTVRPYDPPRLRKDGTPIPPMAIERLWLAMKMSKVFEVDELVEQCAPVAACKPSRKRAKQPAS